jgi:uncharacterized membrane protein YphA (DoxX/SURF4 family)
MAMTARTVAYWTTTAFVAFALISGGYGELTRQWGTLDTVTILGYPAYFLTIIGVWKVAGGIALLVPRFSLVKEWAYAGIVFNMTGAFVSHAAVGDYSAGAYHLITTGSIALLAVASYVLRPGSRMLAVRRTRLAGAEVPA